MEDLWWACMSVNLRAVRSSLAQVARTSGGRATRASGSTQEPAAKAARSATIDLSERDPLAGSTVLHFACNPAVGSQPRGHLLVLRLLLNHGAAEFINVQNNVGDTPLVVCARQGDSEGLQLLLEASADPSVKNRFGDTALHVAARLGHADLIASLLEWKGVDTGATNCLGKTAGQIANRRVRDLIVTAGSAEGKRTSTGGTPGPGDADEEIANHQTVQSSDSESEKMIGAGSTSHLGKNIGQVANRRACDIISTASVTTASESDGGQTAPVMSLAPAEASTPAAATPPAPAQTSPHSETTAWHAGAKPTSPKARKSSKTKEADKSPRAPRTTRSWTLAQDQELYEAVAAEGPGSWTKKAAEFSVPRNAASLRLRWRDLESKAANRAADISVAEGVCSLAALDGMRSHIGHGTAAKSPGAAGMAAQSSPMGMPAGGYL